MTSFVLPAFRGRLSKKAGSMNVQIVNDRATRQEDASGKCYYEVDLTRQRGMPLLKAVVDVTNA